MQQAMASTRKAQTKHLKLVKPQPHRTTISKRYRSKFEARIAATLNKNRVDFSYESVALDYKIESVYTPDFILPSGVIVETKGHFKPEDRRKMLAVKAQHPHLDIRLCFQNANDKISRAKRSMSYGQWATRHGFAWSSGNIPTTWY